MIQIEGICGSEGVATGPIYVFDEQTIEIESKMSKNPRSEIQRFWNAKEKAKEQITELLSLSNDDAGSFGASIFEAYLVYLDDIRLKNDIESMIINDGMSAEYAVQLTGQKYIDFVAGLEDNPRIQARAIDLMELQNRLLLCLQGDELSVLNPTEPSIIVAKDLTATHFFSVDRSKVLGYVLEEGSYNSHFAILARSYGIPIIFNAKDARSKVEDGQNGALYATEDELIIDPTDEKIEEIEEAIKREELEKAKLQEFKGHDTLTHAGERIILYANVSSLEEVDTAMKNDAEGIGLFRTEYIYLSQNKLPTQEEQYRIYREAVKKVDGKIIVFRTADIGGDKQAPYLDFNPSINPSMGSRGIRFSMSFKNIFKDQLKALYRAAYHGNGNVNIMYPMISRMDEIDWIEGITKEVVEELEKDSIHYKVPDQGVVIETPAAALLADEIADRMDFLSIGSNDLSQFLYAIDRMSQNVSLEDYDDEAIKRVIKHIVSVGEEKGVPIGLCGDISNKPKTIRWILDVGIKGISVQPRQILLFRKYIREM